MFVPAAEKDIKDHATVCKVYANFQAGEAVDIYCRIQNNDLIYPNLELRNPVLGIPDPVPNLDFSSHLSLIISIYVLLFFLYTRDISYLYLFGMLFALFLHYQILQPYMPLIDWFFPQNPQLVEAAWIILTMGSFALFLQFGRTFTNMRELSPTWDRIMLWSFRSILVFLLLKLFTWAWGSTLYRVTEEAITAIVFLVNLIVVIRLLFIKNALVRYFVFGAAWLFFFSLLGVLWQRGIIPFFTFPNPRVISQVGFMLIYAFALAYKIQISERAKSEVDKIREIDTIKSRFFANISHEFRR